MRDREGLVIAGIVKDSHRGREHLMASNQELDVIAAADCNRIGRTPRRSTRCAAGLSEDSRGADDHRVYLAITKGRRAAPCGVCDRCGRVEQQAHIVAGVVVEREAEKAGVALWIGIDGLRESASQQGESLGVGLASAAA